MKSKSKHPPSGATGASTPGTPVLPSGTPANPVILLERALGGAITLARVDSITGKKIAVPVSGDASLAMLMTELGNELSPHESFALVVGSGARVVQADKATQVFGQGKPGGGGDIKGPDGGGGPKGIVNGNTTGALTLAMGANNMLPLQVAAQVNLGMPVLSDVGFLLAARGGLQIAADATAGYQSFDRAGAGGVPATVGTSLFVTMPGTTIVTDIAAQTTTALPVNVVAAQLPADPTLPANALGAVDIWVYGRVNSFVTGLFSLRLPSEKFTVTVTVT